MNHAISREEILNQVYQIAKEHLQGQDVTLFLFGSWATGKERKTSDIDVGVYYQSSLPRGTLARMRLDYEESNIPYHIDLVDLTHTDADFREKVMEEGIQWNV